MRINYKQWYNRGKIRKGGYMLHIYSGNGKGKTTAGMGLVLRQLGCEHKALVAQFLKDGKSSEIQVLKQLPMVKVCATDMPKVFYFQMNEEQKIQTQNAINDLFSWVKQYIGNCDCVLLDEILDVLNLGLLEEDAVCDFLLRWKDKEIIMTGRNPSKRLLELCDYHTEMVEKKHPYQKGIPARLGVEY